MSNESTESVQRGRKLSLIERIYRSVGPLAGGLILDFADILTFGYLGFSIGPVVGAVIGWWISSIYHFKVSSRIIWAVLAALYLSIPATELLPIATIISALAKFQEKSTLDD